MMTRMKNPRSSQGRLISPPRSKRPRGPKKQDGYAYFQAMFCSVPRLHSRGCEPPDSLVCLQNLQAQQQQAAFGSSGKGMLGRSLTSKCCTHTLPCALFVASHRMCACSMPHCFAPRHVSFCYLLFTQLFPRQMTTAILISMTSRTAACR